MTHLRLRFDIAYDGRNFHGWAKQSDPSIRTVQSTIESVLSLIAQESIDITCAGRTDAGVHAAGQVAHADIPRALLEHRSIKGDPSRLIIRLRKLLPADISIFSIKEVDKSFDARFSALERHYEYRLSYDAAGVYPLRTADTAHWEQKLDIVAMNKAAQYVVGLNNFAAFSKPKPHATTIRDLKLFEWVDISTDREPHLLMAKVQADAFCWHMVRGLVGACIAIGAGKYEPEFMKELLKETQRTSLTPVAPACGLSLVNVLYPPQEEWADRVEITRNKRDSL